MKYVTTLTWFLIGCATSMGGGLAVEDGTVRTPPVQHLLDRAAEVRNASARQIREDHEATVRALIRIVEQNTNALDFADSKLLALELLGDMRAIAAVDVLIANIRVQYSMVVHTTKQTAGSPSADALVKIGKPSSKAALERLKKCVDINERGLLVEVIKGVEGAVVAKFIVSNAISEVKSADEKAALQKASDILDSNAK